MRIHTSTFIKVERTLNRPVTKFFNGNGINVIAAELRLTKTRPTSFYKKQFFIKNNVNKVLQKIAWVLLKTEVFVWFTVNWKGSFSRNPADSVFAFWLYYSFENKVLWSQLDWLIHEDICQVVIDPKCGDGISFTRTNKTNMK